MATRKAAYGVARFLRQRETLAEKEFWSFVRGRQFRGLKFLRQHPVFFKHDGRLRFFVADFYCASKKLVVEIDGGIHESQSDYDRLRSEILEAKGLKVLRLRNREVFAGREVIYRRLEEVLKE